MIEQTGGVHWTHVGFGIEHGMQWEPRVAPIVPVHLIAPATSERFEREPAHVGILDAFGNLLWTNQAWREFPTENRPFDARCRPGVNYLDICDRAFHGGSSDAKVVAEGIRDVIGGRYNAVYFRYGFDGPQQRFLFAVRVTRLRDEQAMRIAVVHERIL